MAAERRRSYAVDRSRCPATFEACKELTTSKRELVRRLNEDLAAECSAIIRCTYPAGKACGLLEAESREISQREGQDELGHPACLNDAIIDLGGEPTTAPKESANPGSQKAMLEQDLGMEAKDVPSYTTRAGLAAQLGVVESRVKLEEVAADEVEHGRGLRRPLRSVQPVRLAL